MTNIFFFAFRAFFITLMTIGMMASLTEFRFGRKKLLLILGIYGAWVAGSSSVLLWIGGEFLIYNIKELQSIPFPAKHIFGALGAKN